MLDTTYILPAFGIHVDVAPASEIKEILRKYAERGVLLYVSEVSIFEAYVKTIAVAKKRKIPNLFGKAVDGVITMLNDPMISIMDYKESEILEEASKILKSHNDPFDAIIFATAVVKDIKLATEGKDAEDFLSRERILKWQDFIIL